MKSGPVHLLAHGYHSNNTSAKFLKKWLGKRIRPNKVLDWDIAMHTLWAWSKNSAYWACAIQMKPKYFAVYYIPTKGEILFPRTIWSSIVMWLLFFRLKLLLWLQRGGVVSHEQFILYLEHKKYKHIISCGKLCTHSSIK